jgi:Cof subfamily protein (haloacid dehalogenase superfamily)
MKLIFIDVDGTLLSHKGEVPDSAKSALLQAKAKGHKLFLSTGRALSELNETILCVDYDGMIVCGGNTVVLNNQVIYDQNLDQNQLSELYAYFDDRGIAFYAEANSGLYASKSLRAFLNHLIEEAQASELKRLEVEALMRFSSNISFNADLMRDDINKITFVGSDHPFDQVRNDFGDRYSLFENLHTVFGKNSGEITLKGADKAVGIQLILDYLGVDKKHTVGIGDANNDLEMLKFVDLSIAMGNGTEAVKAVADYITKHVNEDGLAHAFEQLKLI